MTRLSTSGFRLMGAAVLFAPALALAAPIGSAISVKPAAQSEGSRGTQVLARGSEVEAFDRISTGRSGATKLRFLDASTLDVGEGALVTLDRFVFNPDRTAAQASLTMARGGFRWVSGRSPKDAYDLKTPLATIGIRGTDIRVFADAKATTVRLQSGAVRACSRISGQCGEANRPGQGVRLWSDGRVETFGPGQQQQPTRRADLPSGPPPGGGPGGPGAADILIPAITIGIGIATGGGGRVGRTPPGRPPIQEGGDRVGRMPVQGGGGLSPTPYYPTVAPLR